MEHDSDAGINPEANPAIHIRRLMRDGQTDALLEWFSGRANTGLPSIRKRLGDAQSAYQRGLLAPESWIDIQIEAYQAILAFPEFQVSHGKPAGINRAQLENLALQDQLEKALDRCAPLGDPALLLRARFSLLQQEKALDRLELPEWELALHQVKYALVQIIEQHDAKPGGSRWKRLFNRWF